MGGQRTSPTPLFYVLPEAAVVENRLIGEESSGRRNGVEADGVGGSPRIVDASAMRRCARDASDASATSAWRNSGSTSGRIADASATRRHPPIPFISTQFRRPVDPPSTQEQALQMLLYAERRLHDADDAELRAQRMERRAERRLKEAAELEARIELRKGLAFCAGYRSGWEEGQASALLGGTTAAAGGRRVRRPGRPHGREDNCASRVAALARELPISKVASRGRKDNRAMREVGLRRPREGGVQVRATFSPSTSCSCCSSRSPGQHRLAPRLLLRGAAVEPVGGRRVGLSPWRTSPGGGGPPPDDIHVRRARGRARGYSRTVSRGYPLALEGGRVSASTAPKGSGRDLASVGCGCPLASKGRRARGVLRGPSHFLHGGKDADSLLVLSSSRRHG